jgi:hypothetical protein
MTLQTGNSDRGRLLNTQENQNGNADANAEMWQLSPALLLGMVQALNVERVPHQD